MFFGNFYDEEKTTEANKKESEKAKHNREVVVGFTAAFALITTVIGTGFAIKKVWDEMS
jgi:hypothetical protein